MSAAVQQIPVQSSPTKSQLAVAYSVCRAVTRSAAKNFYYAFLVLPAPKRRALYAIYAYMRRCDDLADDVSRTAHERRQKLGAWVEAFHATQAGQATDDPVLLALSDALRSYQIPVVLLDQLAYGTAMDIEESDPRPADLDGVVIVPKKSETDVIRRALEKARGEKLVRKEIEAGMSSTDAFKKYGIL